MSNLPHLNGLFKMIKKSGLLLALITLAAANVAAQDAWYKAESPWYVGAGLGVSRLNQTFQPTESQVNIRAKDFSNNQDSGFDLFFGYNFEPEWILNGTWAVEGGYIDFGNVNSTYTYDVAIAGSGPPPIIIDPDEDANLTFESYGYYLNTQYRIPVGGIGTVDLSAGWILADSETADTEISGAIEDHHDAAALVGIGFTWNATDTVAVRTVLNYYNLDFDGVIDNPYRLGIDVIWNIK
jgi:hypothetical protein